MSISFLDMGSIDQEKFAGQLFFDERVQRVIVAGVKPQEWVCTKYVRSTALCKDAAYIIFVCIGCRCGSSQWSFFKNAIVCKDIYQICSHEIKEILLWDITNCFRRKTYRKEKTKKNKNRGRRSL